MNGIIDEAKELGEDVVNDVEAGYEDVKAVITNPDDALKAAEAKFGTDVGQAAKKDLQIAAQDIFNGGISSIDSSAPYIKAVEDVWAQIPDESDLIKNDLFVMINAFVSQLVSANPTAPQSVAAQTAA